MRRLMQHDVLFACGEQFVPPCLTGVVRLQGRRLASWPTTRQCWPVSWTLMGQSRARASYGVRQTTALLVRIWLRCLVQLDPRCTPRRLHHRHDGV